MTTEYAAYYLWNYLRKRYTEWSAEEYWLFAEFILQGNRPSWLFDQEEFKLFGTEVPA